MPRRVMRMLCCPARSPLNFSSRLAGGIRRSLSETALLSMRNFRRALC